jgi:hypothetical protein
MNTALDVYTFSCATGVPTSHRSSGDGLLRRFSDQVVFDQTNVGDVCMQPACGLALGCLHVLLFVLPTAAAAVDCNQAARTGDKAFMLSTDTLGAFWVHGYTARHDVRRAVGLQGVQTMRFSLSHRSLSSWAGQGTVMTVWFITRNTSLLDRSTHFRNVPLTNRAFKILKRMDRSGNELAKMAFFW